MYAGDQSTYLHTLLGLGDRGPKGLRLAALAPIIIRTAHHLN